MTAPEILDTASPYWLRLYGRWIHLQGIMPVNDVKPDRQFNELVVVDGYRYVQAAPRGPRTWELPYRWATASATAALEAAAYTKPLNLDTDAPTGRTLLLDTNAARANMLEPELPRTYNTLRPVINAGGVWQPSYSSSAADISFVLVREGVTYTAAAWTTGTNGGVQLYEPGSGNPPLTALGTGAGTPEDPELVSVTFTAPNDGEWFVGASAPSDITKATAGLMFFEGDCPPEHYRRGQRTPCQVSVQDPALSVNPIWSHNCSPCDLPRQHATFVVHEVGDSPTVGVIS